MVKTNTVAPHSLSNAVAGSVNDIRGIKAPLPIADPWLWFWVGVGVLAAGALLWWWWRRSRAKAPAAVPAIVVLPHEKARAKLEEALALLDQPGPFCILVSDTIRVYLEERFSLRAPERTTEEFLEELQSSPVLGYDQKRTLGEFLAGCDLVKFARYEPGRTELQAIYDTALRVIEETQGPSGVSTPAAAESLWEGGT